MMIQSFKVISPVDGSVFIERNYANEQEIATCLEKASAAQKSWRQTPLSERIALCHRAVDYFITHAQDIGTEITWQMGRPVRYSPSEILRGFQERAKYMLQIAPQALADLTIPATPGFQRFIRRDPLGTVLVLAPWNYPYLTSVNVIIPALVAGNTVILKHAQQTPLCAERYAEAFVAAGLPDGVFQYLHLTHEQTADVLHHGAIDYVAFTGSVAGGHAIQSALSNRFIPAGLELGGKDPAYVRADADLPYSVENLVDGAFFNSGQSCCGIERIYVHQSRFKEFVDQFVALTRSYVLGNPLDVTTTLGPMVRASTAAFAQSHIDEAVSMGAQALLSPAEFSLHRPGTAYLAPQVLINVNHSMRVMTEETFGPVVGIMPVSSDEEAVALMNDSAYGLTASVWTQDDHAALALGQKIHTGTCFMNRCDYLDPALAWTGVKDSGRGATLSVLGFESLTRPKSFHLKYLPG